MANVIAYKSLDMNNPFFWYGDVTQATASVLSISDGYRTGNYFGSFTYYNNDIYNGTVTSYNQYSGNTADYVVSGLYLNAKTVENYVNASNTLGLLQYGLSGNDVINGSDYNDYLMGFDGNDTLIAHAGTDTLDGGLGTNTAVYSGYQSSYSVSKSGATYLISNLFEGTDTLTNIAYLKFADSTVAIDDALPKPVITPPVVIETPKPVTPPTIIETPKPVISTTPTNGDDLLTGTKGNDTISGLLGNDTLVGGLGADQLQGHKGADVFKFNDINESGITSKTRDTITDFKSSEGDKIDLSGIDANTNRTGDQAFTQLDVGAKFSGKFSATGQLFFDTTTHILWGNVDTKAGADFSIQLNGVSNLVAADFIL